MAARVLNDRYELRSLLGRGGMAEVWEAYDRRLDRTVAVKMLRPDGAADPTFAARFDREARFAAGLSHPNIVAVYDFGAEDGVSYLVMELIRGRSLSQRLATGPLEFAEAVRIAIQVCAALEAAARAGVVHRDVKPGNILITEGGQVKVCDFGIARVAGTAQADLTGSAQIMGTSSYMAPEQVTGGRIDARTDLYGLGCVLYAMLTGRPPFTGDSPFQIAWQHVEKPPPPATSLRQGVPADLERLLSDLLAKKPADRPAGPGPVRVALENADLDTVVVPAPQRPRRPRPALLAGAAAAAVAGVIAAVALATQTGDAGSQAAPREGSPAPSVTPTAGPGAVPPSPPAVTTGPSGAAPSRSAAPGPTPSGAAPFTTVPPVATPPATTPPGETPPADPPGDAVADARAVLDTQVSAGAIDAKDARDLYRRLDSIAEEAADGDTTKVTKETAALREKVTDLHDRGRITDDGYTAVVASLDHID
ncbi:protein kinase [Actinoplanes sp. NPDC051861]|uniref:protein kinase domain-containing protein n=1 Tax=Actinoplanes sp. NPDC051861 TaxID=3155170 RepID=UPI0034434381